MLGSFLNSLGFSLDQAIDLVGRLIAVGALNRMVGLAVAPVKTVLRNTCLIVGDIIAITQVHRHSWLYWPGPRAGGTHTRPKTERPNPKDIRRLDAEDSVVPDSETNLAMVIPVQTVGHTGNNERISWSGPVVYNETLPKFGHTTLQVTHSSSM